MSKTMAISELKTAVQREAEGNFDVYRPLEALNFVPITPTEGKWVLEGDEGEGAYTFSGRRTFMSQICSLTGIPMQYAEKLPSHMFKDQYDYWKHQIVDAEPDKTMLFRLKELPERKIVGRAALSGTYNIFDNVDVVSALEEATADTNMYANRILLNEDRISVSVMSPELCLDLGVNKIDGRLDRFLGGLNITNSETGLGSIAAKFFLWRQWCSNGAIIDVVKTYIMKKIHRGEKNTLAEKFTKSIALATEKIPGYMDLFLKSRGTQINYPEKFIEYVAKNGGVTKKLASRVIDEFKENPLMDPPKATLWDVINAFTFTARSVPLEDKLLLETVGGGLIGKRVPPKFDEHIEDIDNVI